MKIAHISDLHFGMHREEVIQAFIQEAKELQPDLILISGDVTQRARDVQFQLCRDFLNQLPGEKLIVPGNHDIPAYNLAERFINPFSRFANYFNNFENIFVNQEIRILGLTSVNRFSFKDGQLSGKSLKKIRDFFQPPSQQFNCLFFHHNFYYFHGLHRPLINQNEFISCLKESDVDIVCTGHLHYANTHVIEKNNGKKCLLLHAGSLSCQRTKDQSNSYYFLDISHSSCHVSLRQYISPGFADVKELRFEKEL